MNSKIPFGSLTCVVAAVAAVALCTLGMQAQNAPAIQVLPVKGNIYMMLGAGANIVASVGRDGVLLVDTGRAEMADNVIRAYKALANRVMSAPVAISTCVGPGCPPSSPWGW